MAKLTSPEAPCVITGERCPGQDCRECLVFLGKFDPTKYDWVCAFCSPGQWDEWDSGGRREVPLEGLYASGLCPRCRCERLLLVPVLKSPE